MKKKLNKVLLFFLFCSNVILAQNEVTLNINDAKHIIHKNIYGHFAEHLGKCIYDGLYVGNNSKIPNSNGVRKDIIQALKKLKVPVLRWPGGCFADSYHWKDAIGPLNQRKPIENVAWGNVRENNAFGTHEFLNFCEEIGADAYLAVNMGGGTVQEAAEWVQYVNSKNNTSYLTDLRLKYGRTKPWNVKYWGIGNESWDCGGHMTAAYYANEYKKYATFMTSYNNTEGLFRIAVGPGTEDYEWTETIMKEIPLKMIDGLSVHHYSVIDWSNKGSSSAFTEEQYFKTMQQAWRMDNFIKKNCEVMDKYDPKQKVALVVDEWGGWYEQDKDANAQLYQQNTMRDAMIAGLTLNIFNNYAYRVRMANLAQMVNVLQAVILTNKEKMVLTPTYHVMEMYNVHQNAVAIPVNISSNNYTFNNNSIKAISASASKTENETINISVVNMHAVETQEVTINIPDATAKNIQARILHSSKIQDYNSFDNPNKITPKKFEDYKTNTNTITIKLPACSVVVLSLQ